MRRRLGRWFGVRRALRGQVRRERRVTRRRLPFGGRCQRDGGGWRGLGRGPGRTRVRCAVRLRRLGPLFPVRWFLRHAGILLTVFVVIPLDPPGPASVVSGCEWMLRVVVREGACELTRERGCERERKSKREGGRKRGREMLHITHLCQRPLPKSVWYRTLVCFWSPFSFLLTIGVPSG